uniref:Uncharacterized protein n=1 Tax=Anguilla anguilla TaxID=7936 RepID=A0A0E9QI99_ANGAN
MLLANRRHFLPTTRTYNTKERFRNRSFKQTSNSLSLREPTLHRL